jgi:hypothetical protein
MRRNAASVMVTVVAVALPALLGACNITRHRPTAGAGGKVYTLIHCQTRRPDKCTARAQEVCGRFTIIEPLRPSSEYKAESRMVVDCLPEGPAGEAQPTGAPALSSPGPGAEAPADSGT